MPSWKAKLLTTTHQHLVEHPNTDNRNDWGARLSLTGTIAWVDYIKQAAEIRDMTVAAYCRAAISGFVAADLGLDLHEVSQHTPRQRYNYDRSVLLVKRDPVTGKLPQGTQAPGKDPDENGPWDASPFKVD